MEQNFKKPFPEYFVTVLKMCSLLLSEQPLDTLLFATDGMFDCNAQFERHKENPYMYRHIFFDEEKVGALILDFKSNYQISAEPGNIVIREISDKTMEYLYNDCNLSFGPNRIPQFRL